MRVVRFCDWLIKDGKNVRIADQVLRCGTSIGANVSEAQQAQSKKDFIHKMSIALKEANETKYWIELLLASEKISQKMANELLSDIKEILKILSSIVKTTKENESKRK